jgi:hypothetical protein
VLGGQQLSESFVSSAIHRRGGDGDFDAIPMGASEAALFRSGDQMDALEEFHGVASKFARKLDILHHPQKTGAEFSA